MAVIYHGTPMTPRAALEVVMPGRAACVSFWRPDSVAHVDPIVPALMLDNGAYSEWQAALGRGEEFFVREDWTPFYRWLEPRLFDDGRWGVIPDAPGAPSQLNDGLLNDWPFGSERGAPLWHMDGPISRLGRLCEKYDRVCLGWVGAISPDGKPVPEEKPVGCDAYRRKMDEVSVLFGNKWPTIHMMRGVAVARDYPFRQRRQHQPRPKRMAVRLDGRRDAVGTRRKMARTAAIRRQAGGPSL